MDRLWVDGKEFAQLDDIKGEFLLFYQNLFSFEDSPSSQDAREICRSLIPKRIAEDDSLALKRPISVEEIEKAIRTLKDDKALGPDGLLIKFYKANIS